MDKAPQAAKMPRESRTILAAFNRALIREAHIIAERPDLVWQQLYNRLQWEEGPLPQVFTAELARRSAPGMRPWLRLRLAPHESSSYVRRFSLRTYPGTGSDTKPETWIPNSCAFSPDGTYVAAIGSKSLLFVWNRNTGNLVAAREAVGSEFCAFEADGAHLVALGMYRQGPRSDPADTRWAIGVRRWDTRSWQEEKPHRPLLLGDYSYCMAISPNGRYAVAETDGRGRVLVWDLANSTEHAAYELRTTLVHASAFSPDSHYLLVCDDTALTVLDTTTWVPRPLWHGEDSVRACAVAPSGETIVTTYWSDEVKVWTADAPEEALHTLVVSPRSVNRSGGVRCGSLSPDGARTAVAGSDQVVRLWDTMTGRELAAFEGHNAPVNTCCFSPDGARVLSASDDGQLFEWDTQIPMQHTTRVSRGSGSILACGVSPDGSFLVTAGDDEVVRIWDPETGAQIRSLSGHREAIVSCAISPDASVIVTGDKDEMLRIWDTKTGNELAARRHAAPPQGRWPIDACCFSPDGSFFLASLTARGEKRLGRVEQWSRPGWVWRQAFDAELAEAKWSVDGYVFAIGPDGSWMVSGRDTHGLTIWDLTTGRELNALPCLRTIRHCAISPDGTFIVAAESSWQDLGVFVSQHLPGHIYFDHHILVWDTSTKQVRLDLTFSARFIVGCGITPDGASIVAANNDGILQLWDASSGALRATFTLPETLLCFALHPWKPLVLGGGPGGAFYSLNLQTIEYGPIIVTAGVDDGGMLSILCPVCHRTQKINEAQLGSTIACSQPDCLEQVRINPFTLRKAR